MRITRRTKAMAFFIGLGVCLVGLAVALNVSWIIFHWRQVVPLVLGIILFGLLIAGMVINTIFLVREIRRNEQQDSFLNAITHELKTPTGCWGQSSKSSKPAKCGRETHGRTGKKWILRQWCAMRWDWHACGNIYPTKRCISAANLRMASRSWATQKNCAPRCSIFSITLLNIPAKKRKLSWTFWRPTSIRCRYAYAITASAFKQKS